MNGTLRRWGIDLPAGTGRMASLLVAVYLAALGGRFFHAWDGYRWLPLESPAFWHGQFWRVLSYPLLPAGFVDLLVNVLVLAIVGSRLERAWPRGELWSYCLLVTLGVGVIKVVLSPAGLTPLVGLTGVVYGLLAAWARLFGHEEVWLLGLWRTRVRPVALGLFGLGLLFAFSSQPAAWFQNLIPFTGGLVGWLYLSLRWRRNRAGASRAVISKRISKLEL